jgi:hypothetical protein
MTRICINLFLIGILLFSHSTIFAQTTPTPPPAPAAPAGNKGIMLGVNGTAFIKNFLSFNDVNSAGTSPYQFTFRKLSADGTKAFRSNIGLNLNNATNKQGDNDTKLSFYQVSIAPGYEKRNQIAKRWLIYGGVDLLIGYELTKTENTSAGITSTNEQTKLNGGIAPVFGLQFNITERLSLSTESQLRLQYTQTTTGNSGLGNNISSGVEFRSIGLSTLLPGFIYVNVSF